MSFIVIPYTSNDHDNSERALATLYVEMGPVFSVLGGFDTTETHIRHVHNLILIAEMKSASLNKSIGIMICPQIRTDKRVCDSEKPHIILLILSFFIHTVSKNTSHL